MLTSDFVVDGTVTDGSLSFDLLDILANTRCNVDDGDCWDKARGPIYVLRLYC